jgi:C1A family cysteine protease
MHVIADLRAAVPGVRDQRERQTCLAFAVTAAHNYHRTTLDWFSVEYLFYYAVQHEPNQDPRLGLTFGSAETALREQGQPEEPVWPYLETLCGPLPIPPDNLTRTWRHESIWEHHNNADKVLGAAANQPIVVGIKLSDGFYKSPRSPFLVDGDEIGFGGHAVLGIGTGIDAKGLRWLLIRNSWGFSWGDSGDAWLSERYLANNLLGHMRLV